MIASRISPLVLAHLVTLLAARALPRTGRGSGERLLVWGLWQREQAACYDGRFRLHGERGGNLTRCAVRLRIRLTLGRQWARGRLDFVRRAVKDTEQLGDQVRVLLPVKQVRSL